jgi:peptidoglycan hydrolase CwlO-like protein
MLHKQIDPILTRIGTTAEQIHKLTDENRMLKKNISKLQRQLAEKNSAFSV